MAYDKSDPRASLATAPAPVAAGPFTAAAFYRFYDEPPDEVEPAPTWYARGQNFVLAYSEAARGATFARPSQIDEYALLLPDERSEVVVEAQDERARVTGFTVTFVPPGRSRIEVMAAGRVVRLFTTRSADLVERGGEFAENLRIGALEAWPEPADGLRIRSYSLDVAPEPGRFGRIFRSTTFMVNYTDVREGPRDPTKLSPHHHDDFEQCSLVLEGEYVHHLRWPWTTNRLAWRADEHVRCASPSVATIPPPAIHTSEAVGAGTNLLIDIFCPPRLDFSERPGWVLNAGDYPMPAT